MQLNNTSDKQQTRRKQAKKPKGFTLWAKTALVREGMTVGDLASLIGKARSTVSTAIHHPSVLPEVVTLIKGVLS